MFSYARRPILSAVTLIVASVVVYAAHLGARDEVRALWVARSSLSSPQAIESMVAAAQQSGFNALLVEVRGRGDSYFLNGLEPRPSALATLPTFDPLAEAIAKAHARGLALHAWINVNLVAGSTVPSDRTHIVYKHPEWLMVSRQIADDVVAVDPTGPEYLGRLTRYARSHRELDGLYLSPGTAAAVEYTTAVIRDIASRYAVDGVHFEDVRYPGDDFDYSRETLTAFRKTLPPAAPALRNLQLYPASYPDRWREFRIARLTALVTALRGAVKSARPGASVSIAVTPQPAEAKARYMQDWTRWLADGLV